MPRHVKKARKARRLSTRTVAGLLCLILSALCGTVPFVLMIAQDHRTAATTASHDASASSVNKQRLEQELANAHDYNRRLAEDGQNVIGEVADPWAGAGTTANTEDDVSVSDTDANYQRQLSIPADGIMATIRYPRLGINLPVRHGTSQKTLARGAGHLYGTSLPVGGKNTHSVISAHTGLADQLMFDKLRGFGKQARKGDFFYLNAAGRTIAYKVVSIDVVKPNDFRKLKIEPGKDLVTLLTCTPYGINDHRLLVTGARTTMPQPAPKPSDAPQDHTDRWFIAYIAAFWLAVIVVTAKVMRRRRARKALQTRNEQ